MTEPSDETCPGCFHPRDWDAAAACPICKYRASADRSGALLPVGTRLERYVIGEKLGQGGFGITYRGLDLKLHMKVAVKEYYPIDFVGRSIDRKMVMLNSHQHEELFHYGLRTFLKEARTLAQMKHPRLVRVLNYFEMNGTAYLVMDYYEGEDLTTYLARQPERRLPWRRAVTLLLPVLEGLQEVHRAGFMHRDLKPSNFYLTRQDRLILLDFGAARQVTSDHSRSLLIYSNGYAPYEQYLQDSLSRQGPWTDVYGAGATLYFMLTAQRPPSGLDRKQKMQLRQPDLLEPARYFVPSLPLALNNMLQRALAVEPEQRLQSIAEFKQQLEALLEATERLRQPEAPPKPRPSPEQTFRPRPSPEQTLRPRPSPEQTPKPKPRPEPTPAGPKLRPKWTSKLNPWAAVIVVAVVGLVWGGWWIGFRMPPDAPKPLNVPVAPVVEPVPPPAMVRITGGCFQMGSPASEPDRGSDERQHRVCVKNFEIGQYEVTQRQWQAVMGNNPSYFQGCADCPVEQVSWEDIRAYLSKLNTKTGQRYRLPTEAEWEYACRGGVEGQRYCGGEAPDPLAWYDANSTGRTHPVGRKAANGFGLYDMSGNAWEWTCSVYDEAYGGAEQKCMDDGATGLLAVRGGSWYFEPAWVRSAYRFRFAPATHASLGFRLAKSL